MPPESTISAAYLHRHIQTGTWRGTLHHAFQSQIILLKSSHVACTVECLGLNKARKRLYSLLPCVSGLGGPFFGAGEVSVVGAVLCIAGCWAASLARAQQLSACPPPSPVVTVTNSFRRCQAQTESFSTVNAGSEGESQCGIQTGSR